MFLGLFQMLIQGPISKDTVITGVTFLKEGETAWVKVKGVPHDEVSRSVKHLKDRGWKVTGITTRKEKDIQVKDGFRPIAAYLRA